MKKLIALLMVMAICLSLCACGVSAAAKECEAQIAQIGSVTLNSGNAIEAAEAAFNALTDKEKGQIPEAAEALASSRDAYDDLVIGEVSAQIAAIGTVTKNSANAITDAEDAYNALSASQKAKATSIASDLENLWLQYNTAVASEVVDAVDAIGAVTVDSGSAIATAEAAYNALTEDQKALIADCGSTIAQLREQFDGLVVQELMNTIDAIGEVTLDSGSAISAARAMYDALTPASQRAVTNYGVLVEAEAAYAQALEAEKQRVLDEISDNFEIDSDRVNNIDWYMHEDMPDYIDTRCYLIPYIGVQGNNSWVCIRYNYTEDDWIFWETITIVTDNDRYYKFVDYFDVTRDNDGDVWEWWDEPLKYNQALDTAELLMLRDIADSEEVIVRFEGDEYYYDYYVTDTDKAIIDDVLALYNAMIN